MERPMKQKHQTPAQRVANPVWLRDQIKRLITDCVNNITEDQDRADRAPFHETAKFLARVECHRHWKQQLERVLRGRTVAEAWMELLDDSTAKDAVP